jgi:uncharacterized protein with NRDE domain
MGFRGAFYTMSFLSIAWKHFSDYPLVMLYNRDEARSRDSEPLHCWDTHPPIYGGKDLKSGTPWLAISETGKFAALTDFHHAHPRKHEVTESRGQLLLDYLTGDLDPDTFLRRTLSRRKKTLPCNLILGDHDALFYACSVSSVEEQLSPGLHHISDYFMDTPMPKCHYMQQAMEKHLTHAHLDADTRNDFFELLANPMRFPDDKLPHRGFDPGYESEMSPLFIDLGNYGTVSSAIITINTQGQVIFAERSYAGDHPQHAHQNAPAHTQELSFQIKR